jgi:prophage tail gpP-like protein
MVAVDRWTQDEIVLELKGVGRKCLQYRAESSIFRQPSAFAARVGYAGALPGLLRDELFFGEPFKLRVLRRDPKDPSKSLFDWPLQTGRIDAVDVSSDGPSEIEFRGRDNIAALFDSYFLADRSFSETSYFAITQEAMRLAGVPADVKLLTGQEGWEKVVTGYTKAPKVKVPPFDAGTQVVEQVESGKTRIVYNTIKAEIGSSYFNWLKEQYKRAGLFLWAAPFGDLILSRPNGTQDPIARITRRMPGGSGPSTRAECNVLRWRFGNDFAELHARVRVFGRGGGGKGGRRRIEGLYEEPALLDLGMTKEITYQADVRTQAEADILAAFYAAEERRKAYALEYTVAGHTTESLTNPGQWIPWTVNTVVEVTDELVFGPGPYYLVVGDLTFERTMGGGTTTTIKLYRPNDLVFAEGGKA